MSRRSDPSRDLRLGLRALETGVLDGEQLASAVGEWAASPGRTLADVIADRGVLDAEALSRLVDPVAPSGPGEPEPTATFALAGPWPIGAPRDDEPPGERGRFRALRPLARGGLGEVFVAFDRQLNRSVALKELQARFEHDPASQARFLVEAEVTGRLEHPGIVPVYSLGRHEDGRPFYAMRLIEGETLRAAIARFHAPGSGGRRQNRDLAFRRLLRCVIDACNAVAYAHDRGVVHRDLKPENIMIGRFGETLVVDWGVAKVLRGPGAGGVEPLSAGGPSAFTSETRAGSVVGTPRYMSPEQAAGDLDRVGPASDVYGLGAILYAVLVGRDPFPDGDLASVLDRASRGIFPAPRRVRRSVAPALEAICLKAMATDPACRHASPLELAEELEAWLADVRYRGEQEVAIGQMRGSLARLCLERAHACFGESGRDEGMLWLARALEHAPPALPDLERVIRTSLSAWHAGARLLERSLRHVEVLAVAFCPEGRRLATAGGGGEARLWDVSTGAPLADPLGHRGPALAVAFSPDGALLATSGEDGSILRWDATTGSPAGGPIRIGAPAASLAFGAGGSRIAAEAGAGGPFLWDAATGRPVGPPASARVLAVAFSPDGETLAAALEDGSILLRDAEGGADLGGPLAQESPARVLAFDPAGRWLLAGCLDGTVRLWDVARRVADLALPGQGEIRCAAFRPGGDAFAIAGDEGTARLRDSATGRPIGGPLDRRSRVDCLAFRPDGTMLATGGPDGQVRLWCAATGLPVGPPMDHGGPVRALAFAPDGRRLATGGPGTPARCWTAPGPMEGDVERVACWVRLEADLEFDEGDAIRRMDVPASWDLRRRLADLGGPPPGLARQASHPSGRRPGPAPQS